MLNFMSIFGSSSDNKIVSESESDVESNVDSELESNSNSELDINMEETNKIKTDIKIRREKLKKILNDNIIKRKHNEIKRNQFNVNEKIIKHKVTIHYLDNIYDIHFVVNNLREYKYNNELNEKHINKLKENIDNNTDLVNTIILIKIKSKLSYYILDGHHRIKSFMNKNINKLPRELLIQVYYVDSLEAESTHNLYKSINNTKPFSERVENISRKVVQNVKNYFGKTCKHNNKKVQPIKTNKTGTIRFPYVNENDLINRLNFIIKEYIIENNESTNDIDCDKMYQNIINCNTDLSKKNVKIDKNRIKKKEKRDEKMKQIKEMNFYLGIKDLKTILTMETVFAGF